MEQLAAYTLLLLPLIFSPGPANLTMCTLAGRYQLAQVSWFILGANVVTGLMVLAGLLGAAELLEQFPAFAKALKYAGCGYLLWIAIGMLKPSKGSENSGSQIPAVQPGFWQGLVFQSLNPKLMLIIVATMAGFDVSNVQVVAAMATVFVILHFMSHYLWALFGQIVLKQLAESPGWSTLPGIMLLMVSVWMLVLG
ncbi:LysE family transporter [Parendozoicomonas sp. Alg238-R29]|uniref:LysE family translocator n=1 Tax=Parendozoicomonas sp. Alg238-R29 TaxID=2993446 RepID=UPI00248E127F|nr:LysE family transporter [Parendozoicomonas sp. Alg238-R29]